MARKSTYEELEKRVKELEKEASKCKQAEEKLKENEERFRQFFENQPEYSYMISPEGVLINVNKAALKALGYMKEELVGKPVKTIYAPEVLPKAKELFLKWGKIGKLKDEELVIITKKGDRRTVLLSADVVKDRDGKILHSVSVQKDITERKQIEEVLRKKTHDLGERVKELNCLYNISHVVEKTDISLEETLQETVDLIPLSWQYPEITCARLILQDQTFTTDNFNETVWKQASDIMVHGERIGALEVIYLEERPGSDEGPFLKEERSLINAIVQRLGKVIERKQAEVALRKSEENYRSLVNSTEDSIYLVDRDCRYLFMNEKHLSRFGLLTDKVIGRAYSEFHFEDETEGFEEKVKEVFETGTSLSYEYRSQRDGRYFIRTLSPVKEPDGRTTAVTVVSKNITERKRAEEALRQAAALKTLTTVLKNFIGDSLSNLLFIVYSQLDLCKLSNSIDQVRSNISAATQGLTELIQGTQAYQEFSSLREGSLGDINSVALGPILEPLLSGEPLQTYQKKRFEINPQVRLRFVYDPKQQEALSWEELPSVSGSSLAIATALQETLINAVESYDPKKGGDVVVSAKKEGYNLILEIADKGRGMSNEEREKSQLPFFKILGIKGSARLGLGAYIARQSAKYCEGDIHIESREALGTSALIILKISDKIS